MEPLVQYCTTSDGVRIAYATAGEGPALVWLASSVVSHVQLEWRQPSLQRAYNSIIATRTLVRLDQRGIGLSDREVEDLSLDGQVRDVEAVIQMLALPSFALLGVESGGATAIAYAIRHPERVSHLVLMNPIWRFSDVAATPQGQAILELVRQDWEMFTESVGGLVFGYRRDEGRQYGDLVAASTTADVFLRGVEVMANVDLTELLPQVKAPTLVVHHTGIKYVTTAMMRDLAARVPNARLHVVAGAYADEAENLTQAIMGFLGESEDKTIDAGPSGPGAVRTVLFTDITDSTALTQRLGDAKAQELVRAHNAIVREALAPHGGSEIKHTGDGIMASFPSASGVLECAVAIQRAVEASEGLSVHIGLNAGEPVEEESDLFGTAVQLARRICDQAEGGEILASDVVRQLAAGKGFLFADRGEVALRGFEDPVRLYEVRWREESA